jgi:threonyl-tRNA synthetase
LFAYNPFKVQLIQSKIPDGGKVTAYRNGDLIDLCTGPHVPDTSRVKAFKVMQNASAYWLGKDTNDSLQRIRGVTFPSKKELDEHIHFLEEAKKRDHRLIG